MRIAAPMPAEPWPASAGRTAGLEDLEDLAEAPADAAVRAGVGAAGRGHAHVQISASGLGLDAASRAEHVAEGQGLLGVVGIQARHPPAKRLLLPGPLAVHEIVDLAVMGPDLLGAEPFEGGPQGVADGQAEQAAADAVDAGQLQASWQGSFGSPGRPGCHRPDESPPRLDETNVTTRPDLANRFLRRRRDDDGPLARRDGAVASTYGRSGFIGPTQIFYLRDPARNPALGLSGCG